MQQQHDQQCEVSNQNAAETSELKAARDKLAGQLKVAMSYRALYLHQQQELSCLKQMMSLSKVRLQQHNLLQQQSSTRDEAWMAHMAASLSGLAQPVSQGLSEQVAASPAAGLLQSLLAASQQGLHLQHETLTKVRREREHFKQLLSTVQMRVEKWKAAYLNARTQSRGRP